MKFNLKNIQTKHLFLLTLLIIIAIVDTFKITWQKHTTSKVITRHIMIGAWTEGLFNPDTQQLRPKSLLDFEHLIQKKLSIAHFYRGWEALTDPNLITQFNVLRKNEWTPMLNVNPYYFSQCPVTQLPIYKAIAEGKCDDFLHSAGKNLSKVKQPFFLLFAWEMNNKQNEWSVPYSASNPDDFIKAWRHIHTVFRQEKATNILWVFCPNVPDDPIIPYKKIYPGDEYVDWIGLDGYNWGTTQSWSKWVSFSGVFTASYQLLTQIAPNKPLVIAEVNTTDQGGDKGAWYKDMLIQKIPNNFPKISAIVIFNEDRSKQEHVNWNVDVTPGSLRAFTAGIHTKFY